MPLRKLSLCFLGAALATTILTTGCQPAQPVAEPAQPVAQPAQPVAQSAPNETVIYNRWEVETHRAHKEINQRAAEEQKEYREWREKHRDVR
jgi:hypothetical protein